METSCQGLEPGKQVQEEVGVTVDKGPQLGALWWVKVLVVMCSCTGGEVTQNYTHTHLCQNLILYLHRMLSLGESAIQPPVHYFLQFPKVK